MWQESEALVADADSRFLARFQRTRNDNGPVGVIE